MHEKDKKIKELTIRLEARKGGRDISAFTNTMALKETVDMTLDLSLID